MRCYRLVVFTSYILSVFTWMGSAAAEDSVAKVYLTNPDGERYFIGDLSTRKADSEVQFSFTLNNDSFGDYFLSMRPFRCLEKAPSMVCYLPYPYDKPTVYSDAEMRAIEYDFLFIHRKSADYGIDPWNGLYYKLQWDQGELRGSAYAVDLNVLASPPENGEVYPLSDVDLHELDPDQLWLPTLEIEGLKP